MAKFYILQVVEGKGTFREVEGVAVEIIRIPAFTTNMGENISPFWTVTELASGLRIGGPSGTPGEAITDAQVRVLKCGKGRMLELCEEYIADYGRSPSAPDPGIIQEPQKSGEIETCEAYCKNPCTQRR